MNGIESDAQLRRTVFAPYYAQRLGSEAAAHGGALTPAQELAFIEAERVRTLGAEGGYASAPTGEGTVVRLPSQSQVVVALRENRPVDGGSNGREMVRSGRRNKRLMMWAGIGMLGLFLLIVALIIVGLSGEKGTIEPVESMATAVITPTVTVMSPTPTPTMTPTITPTITPTELPNYLKSGRLFGGDDIAADAPVSLEIGGRFMSVATVGEGEMWGSPAGVEWWSGTHIRRVFAMPWEAGLRDLIGIESQITVRLRSGISQKYAVTEQVQVHRLQTEILSEKRPSILLIFVIEGSDQRQIVVGDAIQK